VATPYLYFLINILVRSSIVATCLPLQFNTFDVLSILEAQHLHLCIKSPTRYHTKSTKIPGPDWYVPRTSPSPNATAQMSCKLTMATAPSETERVRRRHHSCGVVEC
jgi:hypothetical protein